MVDGGEQSSPSIIRRETMTIQGLITKVKTEKPNTFSDEWLLKFVNEIEEDVAEQLHDDDFEPYTSVDSTELLVSAPYDRLYVSYLKSQVDYANEEYASYQLNAEQHVQDFTDFINYIVRENVIEEEYLPSRFRNIF